MTSFLYGIPVEPVIEFHKGDILKDRYQILKQGQGGNSKLYYCVDLWDGTPCTLKTHPSQLAKDAPEEQLRAFHQELYRMTQIPPHRYVVPFYRVEIIQDIYFLVTEWLPGSLQDRLDQLLRSEPPAGLSGKELLVILLSVCEGMKHCIKWLSSPQATFVHGDLKPENILIAEDGTVKLLDFGGGYTREYASEEQLSGGPVSTRSDLYSMGKIMEELLRFCGENQSFLDRCQKIAETCCQRRPEDRIQSFEVLSRELKQIYLDLTGGEPALSEDGVDEIRFRISRLSNLALIGEPVNIYAALTEWMKDPQASDEVLAEGFYQAAEIFRGRGLYQESLPLYNIARDYDHDAHSMVWTGLASVYWDLTDWKNAWKCAAQALTINAFDYFAMKIAIDAMYNMGQIQELDLVLTALDEIYKKRPEDPQALKYTGYIHYLRHDYEMASRYFGKYMDLRKSDWEIMFFYGLSLYISRNTSQAWDVLKTVIQMLETPAGSHLSRRRLACLAISNYCLNLQQETIRYLEEFEKTYEMVPQIAVTEVMLYDDTQLLKRYHPAVSNIRNNILRAGEASPSFFEEAALEIERLRQQWLRESKNTTLSSAVRFLNLLSCSIQEIAYMRSGEYAQALEACGKTLEWNCSSPESWFNKAELLMQLDECYEAIDCYQQAEKYQKDPERLWDIRRQMAEAKHWFRSDPEYQRHMIARLWDASEMWQGKPDALQAGIAGKEDLFDDTFIQSFAMFVKCEVDEAYWLPEKNLPSTVQRCFSCAGVMQQVEGPVKDVFTEAAIQVYDFLISYADTAGGIFSKSLILSRSFRGLAYLYRVRGNRDENLEKAAADFQAALSLALPVNPKHQPQLAEIYDNLGNTFLRKEQGNPEKNLSDAAAYYQKALDLCSEEQDPAIWAMAHYNFGICEFRRQHYKKALSHFQSCLKYFTAQDQPDKFAWANEYICDITSLILPSSSHFSELFDEAFKACQQLLSYYTPSHFPEKHAYILLKMVSILLKRHERLGEGSLVLIRQYYQEINEAYLKEDSAYDLYRSFGKKLERAAEIQF